MLAIHAPCLIVTQRVWGREPWAKLVNGPRQAAERLGAQTVVVHPPFRWQRDYARDFVQRDQRRWPNETDVRSSRSRTCFRCVPGVREVTTYSPDWSPVDEDYRHFTIDLSHTSVSQSDALEMATAMGDRLAHIHIADGLGSAKDEHLVPGRGNQPCAELLERLAAADFDGVVIVEVNTRKAETRAEREADLAEALAFTRLNLASAAGGAPAGS